MDKYFDLYFDTFNDNVPTECLNGYTNEEIIEMIQECIKQNKDFYQMGYVKLEEGMFY